jgi:hypothetical protein
MHSPQFRDELYVTLGVVMTVGFGEMTMVPFDELFEGCRNRPAVTPANAMSIPKDMGN